MNSLRLLLMATVAWAQNPPAQTPPQTNPPIPQSAPAAPPLAVPGAQPGQAQPGQTIAKNEPEIVRHDTRPTFRTGTNLVMVPVIVRDRDGKPIGDLRKEDFQLFDKGKLQIITRFSVEKASEKLEKLLAENKAAETVANEGPTDPNSRPDAMPTRFVAYLFDDIHLSVGDLTQAREAARKYFHTALNPGDRAAIYTTSGTVTEEFTDDLAKLEAALLRIRPQMRAVAMEHECPPMTYYEGDLIMRNDPTALQTAVSDAFMCAGSANQQQLGRGAGPALGGLTPQQAQALAQAGASRAVAEGESNTQLVIATLVSVVNRMATTPGQRVIILVSPGFYITTNYRIDESGLLDKAIHANVMISTLDARGLYTLIPGGDASQSGFNNVATSGAKALFQSAAANAEGDSLGELAEGTGGVWFHNNNDLVEGLKHVSAVPEYQYLIGFSPQNLKYDGSFHKLKVTVRLKTDNLQARRGYYAPRHAPNEEEQAKEEIREAMFSRDELIDIPLALQTQFFKTEDGIKLSILARIDMKGLHFEPKEGRQYDFVTIVTGLFDRNGQMVDSMTKTVEMHLKPENFSKYVEMGLLEKTSFDIHPGKYAVRLVVRDSEGQTMAARNGVVEIPEK